MKKKSILAAALLAILLAPSALTAAILYGDFDGTTVMYLDVTESNATDEQKFGPPNIFGDQLDFNPTNFRAQSSDAAVIEDSQLNMTIMSKGDNTISQIEIDESGDYTLSGLGDAQALATVGANVQFSVTHVDGVTISPIVVGSSQVVFTPNADGEFSLPADAGTAVAWTGSLDYDIDALLAEAGVDGAATKVEVVLDNTLTATAADGGAAFIAKKDFRGLTITVPEPSSSGLLFAAIAGLATCLRRRVR